MKTIVSYSSGLMKFSVMVSETGWFVAVMKYDEVRREYRCIDTGSCKDEAEARAWAWDLSMNGYK